MGVLLDSSVVIKAERLRWTERFMIREILASVGEQSLGLPAVVLTELLHGVYRAQPGPIRDKREEFFRLLLEDIPVIPYTQQVAVLAAQLGGEQAAIGLNIPFVDMMIRATALSLNFSLLTVNLRHFRMIPNLNVIPF
jgi:tRNA(fMet)-specific endonuclease VapC